jgi:DNA adenine methylase
MAVGTILTSPKAPKLPASSKLHYQRGQKQKFSDIKYQSTWGKTFFINEQLRMVFGTQQVKQVINVASVPHRSPFRYPGGKTWLVPHVRRWLASLSGRPRKFVEPFAGGAIVGLSVMFDELTERLALVELDHDVAAVWKVILSKRAKELACRIASFEPTHQAVNQILGRRPANIFERAFATIVRNRVQRGGIMAPGASLMKEGENGRGLRSRWYPETLKRRILEITEKRDRISFVHGDGIEYIHKAASREDMMWFIDPPYTVAGRRLYVHSELDHEKLFQIVSSVRGDFLMSYDNASPIRKLAQKFGFDMEEVAMKNTHHEVMTELLIGKNLDWLRR